MESPTGHDQNADQIAFWNGLAGQHWTDRQQAQDTILAPVSDVLIDRVKARAGERIVDVGCGCGATTIALAQKVGPTGHVLGIDISAPMLARARQIAPAGLPADFVLGDATVYPFQPASFDLLVSRFGVMFFAEPALSFANMRRALRPSARLAFACWREPRENPWMMAPLQAAYKHVPKLPQLGPDDPGPFSFASEQRVIGRGRISRDRNGALQSLARCRGRARSGCGGRGRARNRPGCPRAGGPTAGRAHRRCQFDTRSPRAFRKGTGGAARRIDLDRDGARALTVQVPSGRVLDIKPEQGDSITAPLSVVIAHGECCMLAPFKKQQL